MASQEQLRKVAIYCSSYSPKRKEDLDMTSNFYSEDYRSCENCVHFTADGVCDIDLIDEILSNLAMEQDLKS
ncbi:MAG: hypothetical protein GX329_04575 [Tissierellia bacterium]|nr:hypothetical protein [Tissierellia bacterium]